VNDSGGSNKYRFKASENEEWFEVHAGAVTNTNPGSMVHVIIDTTPICPNMTDAEFRATVMKLRDDAVVLVDKRLAALKMWALSEQARVGNWFGVKDGGTRDLLIRGFTAVNKVMRGLEPKNFVRQSPELDRAPGCVPHPISQGSAAHVCAPDTATHTICIHEVFCKTRDFSAGGDSKLSTIIHECTHFTDTFGSKDWKYTITRFLPIWGQENPHQAINNADSLAGYIVYEY
jgi:peptidyl-Lys metalloendopeptidase